MSRSTDKTDVSRHPGVGISPTAMCMGCHVRRPMLGGRGVGVRWRCVHCVAKREQA